VNDAPVAWAFDEVGERHEVITYGVGIIRMWSASVSSSFIRAKERALTLRRGIYMLKLEVDEKVGLFLKTMSVANHRR
jgi:hypothetical protein